jgi:hypothetical protein
MFVKLLERMSIKELAINDKLSNYIIRDKVIL